MTPTWQLWMRDKRSETWTLDVDGGMLVRVDIVSSWHEGPNLMTMIAASSTVFVPSTPQGEARKLEARAAVDAGAFK